MVEVVSGRTQLRRASGSRFTGRCPFHEEKTPSFSVNPVDKLYYCFGCGKGGDIISFVRETENLDFVGAVEWLAERFRVPIEVEEASPRVEEARRRRERLYAVLDQTATYFERLLWDGDGGRAGSRVSRRTRARRGDRQGVPSRAVAGQGARGQGARARLHARRAQVGGAGDDARYRLLPAAAHVPARRRARPSGRLSGAQAPRGRPAAAAST